MLAFCAASNIPASLPSSVVSSDGESPACTHGCPGGGIGYIDQPGHHLVSVNVLWLGLGPLIWAPLCESYGGRPIYLASMLIMLVSSVACAVAKHYGVQVFMRMLQGFGASGSIAVGAGSIADM